MCLIYNVNTCLFFMNLKLKSWKVAQKRCNEIDVEPLDYENFIGIQVGTTYPKYLVRCLKCGREYYTTYRKGHLLRCICNEKSFYSRAKVYAEKYGFELIEKPDEFYKNLTVRHPVRCLRCGKKQMQYVNGYHMLCDCQRKDLFNSLKRKCNSLNYELLETREEVLLKKSRDSVKVRCLKCLREFESKLNAGCLFCKEDEQYNRAIVMLKDYSLEACFSREEFRGFYFKGKRSHRRYKVRCLKCGTEYQTTFDYSQYPRMCPRCKVRGEFRSNREKIISDFLLEKGVRAFLNYKDRSLSIGKRRYEVDIYLPDYKIGLEFNGFYWHSVLFHDKDYHETKFKACRRAGIKMYSFWEDEDLDSVKYKIMSLTKEKVKVDVGKLTDDKMGFHTFKFSFSRSLVYKGKTIGLINFLSYKKGIIVTDIYSRENCDYDRIFSLLKVEYRELFYLMNNDFLIDVNMPYLIVKEFKREFYFNLKKRQDLRTRMLMSKKEVKEVIGGKIIKDEEFIEFGIAKSYNSGVRLIKFV